MSSGKITHGHKRRGKQSPEHHSWVSMNTRCNNPKFKFYAYYGGRGIKVCDRWGAFVNFLTDMGLRPPGTTLDRIDPDGNYTPENCRWATKVEQRMNQPRVIRYEYKGDYASAYQLCAKHNVNYWLVRKRLDLGWSITEALETESRKDRIKREALDESA